MGDATPTFANLASKMIYVSKLIRFAGYISIFNIFDMVS